VLINNMWRQVENEGSVAHIYSNDNRSIVVIKNCAGLWHGFIYYYNQSLRKKAVFDFESDLDVMKMKCLVIAKSLGWKIKCII